MRDQSNEDNRRREEGFWSVLSTMKNWQSPKESKKKILQHIAIADLLAWGSDRAALSTLFPSMSYGPNSEPNRGLDISHPLSGVKIENWQVIGHQDLIGRDNRSDYLGERERELLQAIATESNLKKLFWWLWRCWPVAVCRSFGDESLLLMPADANIPDTSIWSYTSITAALAGALAGHNLTSNDIQQRWSANRTLSHPYIAVFSFAPVQGWYEASRKMRDCWAGYWIEHYLSAKVAWKLATLYGPDSLLYPSLFEQPLIDQWLLQEWPEFSEWVSRPSDRQMFTAGLPKELVLVLPKTAVESAMQTARQTVLDSWQELSQLVFQELHDEREWMADLTPNSPSWQLWLKAQWQTDWTATPIGKDSEPLKTDLAGLDEWLETQGRAYGKDESDRLFKPGEMALFEEAARNQPQSRSRQFNVNASSWWGSIVSQTRETLWALQKGQIWVLPTAFGPRSSISGLGPVVHPSGETDWITEAETEDLWPREAGLFDGLEQLNATEIVKRGLDKIVAPLLLRQNEADPTGAYPHFTSGLAGYLKTEPPEALEHFHNLGDEVLEQLRRDNYPEDILAEKWGIPWIDDSEDAEYRRYGSRLLNPGWLVEELEVLGRSPQQIRASLEEIVRSYYPLNNPTSWYVLAAGNADGSREWIEGRKGKAYREYVSTGWRENLPSGEALEQFLAEQRRVGPATHASLSRSLLDFSKKLVPYLTEQRHAGRLLHCSPSDIVAYTNLWEWDSWLWDIRECLRGDLDPGEEFEREGDYWRWGSQELAEEIPDRPLMTMGSDATISFGIIIANQSVPLAVALENLAIAKDEAKKHKSLDGKEKDAVEVRVLYGNGKILKSRAKFQAFQSWRSVTNVMMPKMASAYAPALFEQAIAIWNQHPAPQSEAVDRWMQGFARRRKIFTVSDMPINFPEELAMFLKAICQTAAAKEREEDIENWLKLAAFMLRERYIKLGGEP